MANTLTVGSWKAIARELDPHLKDHLGHGSGNICGQMDDSARRGLVSMPVLHERAMHHRMRCGHGSDRQGPSPSPSWCRRRRRLPSLRVPSARGVRYARCHCDQWLESLTAHDHQHCVDVNLTNRGEDGLLRVGLQVVVESVRKSIPHRSSPGGRLHIHVKVQGDRIELLFGVVHGFLLHRGRLEVAAVKTDLHQLVREVALRDVRIHGAVLQSVPLANAKAAIDAVAVVHENDHGATIPVNGRHRLGGHARGIRAESLEGDQRGSSARCSLDAMRISR